jgi:hypothetical protein
MMPASKLPWIMPAAADLSADRHELAWQRLYFKVIYMSALRTYLKEVASVVVRTQMPRRRLSGFSCVGSCLECTLEPLEASVCICAHLLDP